MQQQQHQQQIVLFAIDREMQLSVQLTWLNQSAKLLTLAATSLLDNQSIIFQRQKDSSDSMQFKQSLT